MGSTLPTKEQSNFKQVVRFYELKQFKKALRFADAVLKKFPNHGETLAMKGLVLNALEKKEEAYEWVRLGLRNDLKSHVCWHVYGLLYRSDRDYHEASTAYLRALKFDPENVQILRDLALLQVQIRNFEGFNTTRQTLLTLKPGQKNNWVAFALSHQLLGNYDAANKVLDTYQSTTVGNEEGESGYETSELELYKSFMLEEKGDMEGALKHIDSIADDVVDKLALMETRARLLLRLGRAMEAEEAVLKLLDRNPDNAVYIGQYHEAIFLQESIAKSNKEGRMQRALELCDQIAERHARALLPRRMSLDILPEGDERFKSRLDGYVRWFLRSGVPSLNTDLKSLYTSESKVQAIEELFLSFLESLKTEEKLPPDSSRPSQVEICGNNEERNKSHVEKEKEETTFWVTLFLAQHYDRKGDITNALEMVEKAIVQSPTVIEAYQVKARILKHAGANKEAFQISDQGRKMDLADRNLNTKSAKYAMRADQLDEAEALIALFTRDGGSGGIQSLYDMQCMWYECEAGESLLRQRRFAAALKKFTAVDRHFADFEEDQFDFHTYCVRKVTMRAYVRLLRMEDNIRGHAYFARAAKGIVRVHLELHRQPLDDDTNLEAKMEASLSDLSISERKKAMSKFRKKQAKKQQEVENAKKKESKVDGKKTKGGGGGASAGNGWMETDRDGIELLRGVKDPLLAAAKYVKELERHASHDVEVFQLAFEVAIKRQKYILALRAVHRAMRAAPESPISLLLLVRLAKEVEGSNDVMSSMSQPVRAVFEAEGSRMLLGEGKTALEAVLEYSKQHRGDIEKRIGAGLALLLCAAEDGHRSQAVELMTDLSGSISIHSCEAFKRQLDDFDSATEEIKARFSSACREKWPLSTAFAT